MKFILGKKLTMSQEFGSDGKVKPVTIVEAGPCLVTQVKTQEKDGYLASQIGYGVKKKINKPLTGHLKKLPKFRYLKEIRHDAEDVVEVGKEIKVNIFTPGDIVRVTGVSKGKGFQGVVKRHGFHGSPASHGHKDQLRMPGSIGSTDAARVFKGKRMGGRMGTDQVTVTNLEIIKVDLEKNLLYILGALPGARNGLLLIKGPGEFKIQEVKKEEQPEEVKVEDKKKEEKPKEEPKVEEKKEEPKPEDKKEEEKPKEVKKVEEKK
ncbi:50S ribosomal protein L3 [bacterium]|mgnify:FL=1|jgi:large subunit ribosomal protein L3|nr:50S ribosomal protein L3 [bacterium]MBT4495258.1 50S ribosomal protein L3 [bacterium]MBT4763882.1 50S ribosomal protein L3 [bacterium]MBT5401253.1 50S ribosomal protein L3 [bacterium]MBT5942788.1 50S ribosomal protein L3 [bacterium]